MGRFYNGDIEGKFWFGVQSSNDADFFGVEGEPPARLDYYFGESDLPKVEQGVKKCLNELGSKKEKLDKFFEENFSYNDEMLIKAGIVKSLEEAKSTLEWYARLELGEKIANSIKVNGQCSFEAEC